MAERVPEHELQPFRHQSPADVRCETVVAEVRALEEAASDLAEVVDADQRLLVAADDEEAAVRRGARANEVRVVLARGLGRVHPWAVQLPARACEADELVAVGLPRRPQVDTLAFLDHASHRVRSLCPTKSAPFAGLLEGCGARTARGKPCFPRVPPSSCSRRATSHFGSAGRSPAPPSTVSRT